MKTFEQFLETAPEWIKPKTRDERVRMEFAYTSAQVDSAGDTIVLMQESMLRGVKAAGVEA